MERMRIMGKSNYRLGMYEKSMPNFLTLKEKLMCVKECGFDWMEISIDETDEKLSRLDWSQPEIDELKQAMIDTGVTIDTMCLSGHRKYPLGDLNQENREKGLEIMKKAIDLAHCLGIRIIQLAGYDVYYSEGNDQTRTRFIDGLKLACTWASKKGILMGFETMETPFMDTVGKAMEYVYICQSPYLGVYPDIGNLTNAAKIYQHDVNDDILTGKGHIVAAHLKETKPGHYREVPFGTGHTDYVSNLQVLKQLGVSMFTGEFWYVGQEDWKDICKQANMFLRKHLDEVFERES